MVFISSLVSPVACLEGHIIKLQNLGPNFSIRTAGSSHKLVYN